MPEITDEALEVLLTDIDAMPVPSFYPEGARDAGKPYIERHKAAFGDELWTVWQDQSTPFAVNLSETYKAADEYLDVLDI